MASIVYPAILFIFIFGGFMTFINESNLYEIKMPESGVSSDIGQAQEINQAMLDTSKESGMSGTEQLWLMGKCVIGGVIAIFTLGPLMTSFGIPGGLVTFLISPIGFVAAAWLVEMWLGRPAE